MTQPRKDPKDECREAFERTADSLHMMLDYRMRTLCPESAANKYASHKTQEAYELFQAAYAMPRVDVIPVTLIQPDTGGIEWGITAVELENQYGKNWALLIDDYKRLVKAAMQGDGGGVQHKEACHAGRDGDCNWKHCPQEANNRANYQTCCPLMTDEQKDPYQ